LIKRFFTYTVVGAVGTIFHYLTLIILVHFNVAILPATTSGFIIGALINYGLNYHYTFKSRARHHQAMSRFMIAAGFGVFINGLIMHLLADQFTVHYLIAQIIATLAVLISGYLINFFWTFQQHNSTSKE
jgi:putative flippase GtrA